MVTLPVSPVPPGRPELAAPRQPAPIRRPNKGGPDVPLIGYPTPQRVSKGLKTHIRRFINSVDWWVAVKMLLVLLLGVGMLTWAVRWWLRL